LRPHSEAYRQLLHLAEKDDPLVAATHYNIGMMHILMMEYHLRLEKTKETRKLLGPA